MHDAGIHRLSRYQAGEPVFRSRCHHDGGYGQGTSGYGIQFHPTLSDGIFGAERRFLSYHVCEPVCGNAESLQLAGQCHYRPFFTGMERLLYDSGVSECPARQDRQCEDGRRDGRTGTAECAQRGSGPQGVLLFRPAEDLCPGIFERCAGQGRHHPEKQAGTGLPAEVFSQGLRRGDSFLAFGGG